MTRAGRVLALLLALGGAAHAEDLTLRDWVTGPRGTYLSVPPFEAWRDVSVQVSGLPSRGPWTLRLDGRVVATSGAQGGTLSAALPDVPGGTHQLTISAGDCDAPRAVRATLRSRTEQRRAPHLNEVAALLRAPDGQLRLARLDWPERTPGSVAAALALAQGLGAHARVLWLDARAPLPGAADVPPDLRVAFRPDPALPVPARLTLADRDLTVTYRDEASLPGAVAALLAAQAPGVADAARLDGVRADLETLPALPAARLEAPVTLAEFGLGDYLLDRWPTVQVLRVPPAWAMGGGTGRAQLRLTLLGPERAAVQAGLTEREGRAPLERGQPTTLDLPAAQLAATQGVPLRARLWTAVGAQDATGGAGEAGAVCPAARVDARASRAALNLRPSTGVAALPAALIADPSLGLPDSPQALSFALTLAGTLPGWGLTGTLPWQVRLNAPGAATTTLTLQRTPLPTDIPNELTTRGRRDAPTLTVNWRADADLAALSADWLSVPAQLRPGMGVITVRPGGAVQVRPRGTTGAPWVGLLISAALLPLAALGARRA